MNMQPTDYRDDYIADDREYDSDYRDEYEYPDCLTCGDPIDYCQGHGELG